MPRKSETDNVVKVCGCVKWRTCGHAWYLDYQRDGRRWRDNLDKLIGRHAADFTEARDEARRAIVAKLEGRDPRGLLPADDPTVKQLVEGYANERPRRDKWQAPRVLATALPGPHGLRPLGEWRATDVTTDTLKAFKHHRPLVAGNRDLGLLRAVFNWAVLGGLLPRSPFRIGDVPAVRLAREEARSRRLQGDEPERLLAAAKGLQDLITGALETGCRLGELLSLQWHQVRFTPRAEVFLPATKTKTKRDRRVPISSVLRPILERRRLDPAGDAIPTSGYVFGDEIGRRRHSIKTAWRLTCARAKIKDLHFHDLRREAGSRWMDAGIPLATIQRWLGHTNISQTSTYLGASLGGDEGDMRDYEQRVGRLTQVDVSGGLNGQQPPRTDQPGLVNTQQSPNEHQSARENL